MEASDGLPYGFLLILAGFVLIVVGVLVSVVRNLSGEGGFDAEAGGVVFIGPIPVVFGTSRGVVWIALAVALLMLVSFFVFYR